ncbi:hypothetical protein NDU88_008305 [Pleurodeles waltl]|uniref:Uncharacterized protein n=1 Tax=Pleurodeles waltl TaxID=8319 RepID=A0AAV7VS50_PLEWA|nr:hypothetical protein NDU88_008305 [Pleurodeles waltl]
MGAWPAADEAARLAPCSGARNGTWPDPSTKSAQTAQKTMAPASDNGRAKAGVASKAPDGQSRRKEQALPVTFEIQNGGRI